MSGHLARDRNVGLLMIKRDVGTLSQRGSNGHKDIAIRILWQNFLNNLKHFILSLDGNLLSGPEKITERITFHLRTQ